MAEIAYQSATQTVDLQFAVGSLRDTRAVASMTWLLSLMNWLLRCTLGYETQISLSRSCLLQVLH